MPINSIMNKYVVYLYNKILQSNKNEQTIAIHNKDEYHKHNSEEARNIRT